jgi:hypothetical protein
VCVCGGGGSKGVVGIRSEEVGMCWLNIYWGKKSMTWKKAGAVFLVSSSFIRVPSSIEAQKAREKEKNCRQNKYRQAFDSRI